MVGGCGSARRLADRLRDERWGVRAGRRYGARSGRERRGGLDRPGRLRGRGDIPDGVRRLRRGGHRDHRPAQVVAHRASGDVIPALRVTRSRLDLVTRHGPTKFTAREGVAYEDPPVLPTFGIDDDIPG